MKNIKRIVFLVLSLVLVLTMGAMMVGCGEPEVDTITVTLNYPNGTAVNGATDGITEGDRYYAISVQICTVDEAGEQLACSTPVDVSADGKAVFKKSELPVLNEGDKYKVKVTRAPEGYTANDIVLNGETSVTITLIVDFVTVTLKYPDGTTVNGTTDASSIQICTVDTAGAESNLSSPISVTANGTVKFIDSTLPNLSEGNKYKIKVNAPEGYTANDIVLNGETSVTITLIAE